MNIVFMGTPDFAVPSLKALLDDASCHVKAVYTQPDRPAGRGRKLAQSPVKALTIVNNLPVYQPVSFKEKAAIDQCLSLKPDVIIVAAYGLILPKALLNTPKYGCINVHASLLPRWRGASPIQMSILHGDRESGITIMQMAEGLDTGDILSQSTYPLSQSTTAGELHDALSSLGAKALLNTLYRLDDIAPTAQDEKLACYAPKIQKLDAKINWHESSRSICRQICAYNPYPGAYTFFNEKPLKILQAKPIAGSANKQVGTVILINGKHIDVVTGDGLVRLEKLQLPGKRAVTALDFLNGQKECLVELCFPV